MHSVSIGSHVSIRGGYVQAAKRVMEMGGTAYQYFPKNPRSLTVKTFDRRDAEACARFCREHQLLSVAHSPYPTNLAAEDQRKRELVILSILNDLEIAESCGSIGVVVHFGLYKGKDPLQGYRTIIHTLNEVLHDWEGEALILLENQSGQGARIGTTFEELVQVRQLTEKPEKIGFCLDTCHAFASGLWDGKNEKDLIDQGEQLHYFPHLKVVHLNDSAYPTRSYRDRHANIGRGCIGVQAFKQLFQAAVWEDVPLILETPKGADGTHRQEIRCTYEMLNNE